MRTRRCLLLQTSGLWLGLGASAAAQSPAVLRFTFSRPATDLRTQWLIAVYSELLRRLGLGFEFVDVPVGRGALLMEDGRIDGDLGRSFEYQETHPELVRVPEAIIGVEFSLYAVRPELQFRGWPEVRAARWRCEYRRGIEEMARLLRDQLAPEQISVIPSVEQGLRRLQLGRTDAYLDIRELVSDYRRLAKNARQPTDAPLRELAVVSRTTGHAYLHVRHAALAERMGAELVQMKKEGLVQALREKAERGAGPR